MPTRESESAQLAGSCCGPGGHAGSLLRVVSLFSIIAELEDLQLTQPPVSYLRVVISPSGLCAPEWGTLAPQVLDGPWHAVSALRRVHSSELTILNPFVTCKIEVCPLIRPCIYSAFAGQPARFSAGDLVAHLRRHPASPRA